MLPPGSSLGSYVDQERLPPPRRRDGGAIGNACRPQPGPSLVQRRYCELAPPCHQQGPHVICRLYLMAHGDSRTTLSPSRPFARLLMPPTCSQLGPAGEPYCGSSSGARPLPLDRAAPPTRSLGRQPAVTEVARCPGTHSPRTPDRECLCHRATRGIESAI